MTSSELRSLQLISVVMGVRRDQGVRVKAHGATTPGGEDIGMGRVDLCGVLGVIAGVVSPRNTRSSHLPRLSYVVIILDDHQHRSSSFWIRQILPPLEYPL